MRAAARRGPPRVHAQQREHDLRGVIDVGVVDVGELERPATRLELRPAHRPVAPNADLLAEQPVGGAHECGILRGHAGVLQRHDRERGVPDGRLAGFQPPRPALLDHEALDPREADAHDRMVDLVAAQRERHERVDPGRLDPSPGAVGLLARHDPALRAGERERAQPAQWPPFVGAQRAIPAREPAAGARAALAWLPGLRAAQLSEVERERALGAVGPHNGERDDRLARPAGEVEDVEGDPRGQQRELHRQRRDLLPGPEPEERHPDVREHARVLDAAALADELASRAHVLGLGRVARQPQRPIGLDRGREVAGPAVEVRPGAVRALLRADPRRRALRLRRRPHAQELAQEHVLGVHRDVALELALPPPGLVLQREQVLAGAGQTLLQLAELPDRGRRHLREP